MKSEVQSWESFNHNGQTYKLSHLNAHEVVYQDAKNPEKPASYRFLVTYGLHCFTKDDPALNESERQKWLYRGPRESRMFDLDRYALSKQLPEIIASLADRSTLVFHAGYETFATFKLITPDQIEINYFVAFVLFRENKRLRLHVKSAYPKEDLGKIRKVSFFVLAYNLLKNKPLPQPPK